MQYSSFKKLNTCVAVLVFLVAATTYALTVEPSASLWDCPEFIACGYKLEIGHPPGAPVFMLLANAFAQLASEPSQVALMVNLLSALLSAGCILFLFLTITHMARRLLFAGAARTADVEKSRVLTVEACGLVGALAYTFSDTFWFSAVEAEVYAFSSFLTALMFWLILRWEDEWEREREREPEPERGSASIRLASRRSDRWLLLIAYITGLSIGVHLLCLLCLPAMSLVVYFRRARHTTFWGIVWALLVGGLMIALILYGLIPGVVRVGGWMELFFVNVLGCPYHAGLVAYVVLGAVGLLVAYRCARRRLVKLSLACLMLLLAGYSSYGVILIRAAAHPPMCENAPDNIFSLSYYLGREQYGQTPLLYGPTYCSTVDYELKDGQPVAKQREGRAVYRPRPADETDAAASGAPAKAHYEIVRHEVDYVYRDQMLFPRMHSARHAQAYEDWMGGVRKEHGQPTAWENLRFFLTYQCGFMYWRYFLWNFVGRQNNIQGHGEVEHGNWITGIRPVDDLLLDCDTTQLPSDLRENKGRNVYYALPLLLGLAGLLWQWRQKAGKGRRQFLVVLTLFLMTGLAIVVYLNQTPLQPRERDYAYAGSFYAFTIWIGLGAAAVTAALQRLLRRWKLSTALLSAALCLAVPLQMLTQTWDDHDRSGRYACRDFGANYLQSLPDDGHPIILTAGDNDTFPLWYNHEVEGLRTDTRDCNLEYLQTDWYIDQMKQPAYQSPPLPITMRHRDYQEGRLEYIPVSTDTLTVGQMTLDLRDVHAITKSDLMVLEMLANAGPDRPLYVSISLGPDQLSFLRDHLVLEGLAYRISPETTQQTVDVERLYDNVMHRFRYGGLSRKGLYVDEDTRHMANTHQFVLSILIDSLLQQVRQPVDPAALPPTLRRALAVCRLWQRELPPENVPYTDAALAMARCYYLAGMPSEGDAIVAALLRRSDEWLTWIDSLATSRRKVAPYTHYTWMRTMHQALSTAAQHDRDHLYDRYSRSYEQHLRHYQPNP